MWDTNTARPQGKHGNLLMFKKNKKRTNKKLLLIHDGEKLLNDIYIVRGGLTKWSIMVGLRLSLLVVTFYQKIDIRG